LDYGKLLPVAQEWQAVLPGLARDLHGMVQEFHLLVALVAEVVIQQLLLELGERLREQVKCYQLQAEWLPVAMVIQDLILIP
jgi:hypothetical protein